MSEAEVLEYLKRLSASLNQTSEIIQSMCLNIIEQSSSQTDSYHIRLSHEGRARATSKKTDQ